MQNDPGWEAPPEVQEPAMVRPALEQMRKTHRRAWAAGRSGSFPCSWGWDASLVVAETRVASLEQ